MCGIAGILYRDADRPVRPEVLQAMADSIAHRGPDAEGFYRQPGVGLAHRRLSIIDLAGGEQPMTNEDGSLRVVFNGEIYNFADLRHELASRGHVLRTQSDTEVLVHLYEELGPRLVERLRGMFAFALWDESKRRLLLARDRIGLKPLYVYRDAEKLLFGSEIKAILAHPEVPREIDPAALEDYLAFGFVPGGRAIFRKFEKLPPAHTLTVSAGDLAAGPRRYWSLSPATGGPRTLEGWSEAVDAKIQETVAAHRVADVPVGAFLSGGLDSSAIVATFSAVAGEPVRTFSVGFEDRTRSELPYARQVAEHYGCRHVEETITPRAAAALEDLVRYYDEPFADSSAIPSLLVARSARKHVKVVLSGDGGDEAFGGYARYRHDLWEARLRASLPWWYRRGVLGPLARCWPRADWLPRPLRAQSVLTNLSRSPAAAYANTVSVCRTPLRRRLLAGDLHQELNGHVPEHLLTEYYRTASPADPLAGMIAADIGVLLPDDFLTKVDRASMACGLEVRPPLVDHQLLELAFALPSEWKVRAGRGKWLLGELYRDRLPPDILQRPKQGFEIPTDRWLRGPLNEMLQDAILSPRSRLADWIDRRQAEQICREHLAGRSRHGNLLWSLLVLARWADEYVPAGASQVTGRASQVTGRSPDRPIENSVPSDG